MKVDYTPRVRAELRSYFIGGIAQFGPRVVERTFRRINHAVNITLAAQPYLGQFLRNRNVYRYVIAKTPFVAYYHVDSAAEVITILAIFHRAQDRSEFESD
jgi:plasmid stabilization system protein ParE